MIYGHVWRVAASRASLIWRARLKLKTVIIVRGSCVGYVGQCSGCGHVLSTTFMRIYIYITFSCQELVTIHSDYCIRFSVKWLYDGTWMPFDNWEKMFVSFNWILCSYTKPNSLPKRNLKEEYCLVQLQLNIRIEMPKDERTQLQGLFVVTVFIV